MNVLSAPLSTDPRFNASTGWSNVGEGYAWDILGNGAAVMRAVEDEGTTLRNLSSTLTGERQFRVDLHIDDGSEGSVRFILGNTVGIVRTSPGAYSQIVTATDAGTLGLVRQGYDAGDLRIILLEAYEIVEA